MTVSWREQYDRMQRWRARLSEQPADIDRGLDDFYAFFVVCFHLKDWLQGDPAVDGTVKGNVEGYASSQLWLGLVADLANGTKHGLVDKTPRYDAPARLSESGGRIVVTHGRHVYPALRVVESGIRAWDRFLHDEGLLS